MCTIQLEAKLIIYCLFLYLYESSRQIILLNPKIKKTLWIKHIYK